MKFSYDLALERYNTLSDKRLRLSWQHVVSSQSVGIQVMIIHDVLVTFC